MTKREYMRKAICHQKTDRVPYCIEIQNQTMDLYGNRLLEDFYNKDAQDDLKEGKINFYEAVDLSIGNYITRGGVHWWDWDRKNTDASYYNPDTAPAVMPPVIRYDKDEYYENTYSHCKWLSEKYHTYIAAIVYASHWEKAYMIRGLENFLADIAGAPEFARELLEFIVKQNMEILPKIVRNKYTDAVLLGSDWGTQRELIMSPDIWKKIIMPGEKTQYDLIKEAGKHIIIHSCGCILRIMPELVSMGVDILNPVQPECMDIQYLKETYGADLTFWGGISTQKTLPYGTPEEVRKETERTIKLMSENGGYITNSSQLIQTDVPYENLKALIETARYYT